MRIAPSMRLHKMNKTVQHGDEAVIAKLASRKEYAQGVIDGVNSPFGISLISALENLEANAYNTLFKTSMKSKIAQAKAEIKTSKYLKGVLMGYIAEGSSLDKLIEQYNKNADGEIENEY